MATRLAPPPTAFRMGNRKRPRQKAGSHLDFIRSLPCVICGRDDDTHAAHIRAASQKYGKRETGKSEKPDDAWSVPVCGDDHVFGPDAQHNSNELDWWKRHGIDPFVLALALWRASGDDEAGALIVSMARLND